MDDIEALLSGYDDMGAVDIVGAVAQRAGGDRIRRLYLGIADNTSFAVGTTNVQVNPAKPIRVDRMVGQGASAGLRVTSIKVGNEDMLLNGVGFPIEFIDELAQNISFRGYTVQPGPGITVSITNGTAGAIVGSVGFFGESLA